MIYILNRLFKGQVPLDHIYSILNQLLRVCPTRLAAVLLVLVMMVVGVGETWGATVTYHIINLGRLNDSGALTSTRTEALKFTVTGTTVTVGIPDKYKSPLAKNWKYYSSSDVTYVTETKVCTFNNEPSLNVGDPLSNGAHVYVTYELDEDAFSTVGVFDGGIFRIKFPDDYYLKQTMWTTEINTNPVENPGPNESEFLWKLNIIDPYQITVQSKSQNAAANCFNYFLCSSDASNPDDTRLKATLTAAKNTKVWAFGLLNGGTGTYRLVVTDGFSGYKSPQEMDSFKHGYLNDNYVKSGQKKTTYHRYGGSNYYNCDLTIESVSANYTFHIINNSGEEAMSDLTSSALNAGATITESMIPDMLKSPAACNYSFYPTEADATNGTNAITSLPPIDNNIYVRYETSSGDIYLNGELKYKLSVGGEHYLYAADATTINSAASGADDAYKWRLQGGDPYKFTIKNVDNNQFITYNVSGGEAVPTLSGTGSNFFLHQSTDGKYELVVIDNSYPTSYYTLGYDGTNGLMLYSNTTYEFGDNKIQTVFTEILTAVINPLPTANNLTYNGSEQALVTAGTCAHGTIKYREGTVGEYSTTIPTKKDPGAYSVYYMSEGDEGYENYVAVDPIIVTILRAPVTVTAEDKLKVYGETDPTLTATVTGLIPGEPDITYTISRAADEDAGDYTITPNGEDLQGNYAVSYVNGTLTISKKIVGITWGETSFPYNGSPQAPTATATGLVNGDEIGVTVTGAQTNVGTDYTAMASALTGTKKGNYQLPAATEDKTTTFSIVKATIATTLIMNGWSYGDYDALTNSPSISYNPENVTVTYLYKVKGAGDGTYNSVVPTDAGTYTVQASMEETSNSYAQVLTKDFTISQKALNKDAAGSQANGITVTVVKDTGTVPPTYNVTVTHNIHGVPTTLTPYDADNPGVPYDYTLIGESSVSGYVVTVTAKIDGGVYTGNYTGFAKAIFVDPKFWDDGTPFNPNDPYDPSDPDNHEFAAVYQSMIDMVPNAGDPIVKAYIVKNVNPTIGTVTISPIEYVVDGTPPTKVNYIPEGVPVLLLSNDENTGGLGVSPKDIDTPSVMDAIVNSNQLILAPDVLTDPEDPGSPRGVSVKDAEAYVFYRGEFVLTKEGTISPGKFFLYNPNYTPSSGGGGGGPSGVRRYLRIVLEEDEDPTGIDNGQQTMVNEQLKDLWYTLDGRCLDGKPTRKGIYITNGKKRYFK